MADRSDLDAALRVLADMGITEGAQVEAIKESIAWHDQRDDLIKTIAYDFAPVVYDAYRLGVFAEKDELLSYHELPEEKQKPMSEAWRMAEMVVRLSEELTAIKAAEEAAATAKTKRKTQ